jgi:hypothetical protein
MVKLISNQAKDGEKNALETSLSKTQAKKNPPGRSKRRMRVRWQVSKNKKEEKVSQIEMKTDKSG